MPLDLALVHLADSQPPHSYADMTCAHMALHTLSVIINHALSAGRSIVHEY